MSKDEEKDKGKDKGKSEDKKTNKSVSKTRWFCFEKREPTVFVQPALVDFVSTQSALVAVKVFYPASQHKQAVSRGGMKGFKDESYELGARN